MIADRIRSIQAVSGGGGGGGGATDPYYAYRSLILNFDGNFNDSSPNALAVTDYGDAQIVGDGTFGTVGSFDGSGDKLEIQSNSLFAFGTGDFTIEGWINCSVFQLGAIYTTAEPTDQQGIWIGTVANGKIHYLAGSGSWSFAAFSNATLNTNTWYHIALIRSGSVFSLYINGVFDSSQTASVNLTNSNNLFSVGGRSNFNQFFNGLLGPLRISPWAVYTSNFTPSQDLFPVVQQLPVQDPWYDKTSLILNMDGTPGSTIFEDDSPNALAVTAVGDAQIVSDATFGTVASFDGSGDELNAGSSPAFAFGTGDFTIECFVQFSALPGTGQVMGIANMQASSSSANTTMWWFGLDNSGGTTRLRLGRHGNGSVFAYFNWTPSLNQWYHVAAVRSSSTIFMFVDGVSQTVTSSTGWNQDFSATGTLVIGSMATVLKLNGKLGPTRLDNGVARYTTSFTPPTGKFPTS